MIKKLRLERKQNKFQTDFQFQQPPQRLQSTIRTCQHFHHRLLTFIHLV